MLHADVSQTHDVTLRYLGDGFVDESQQLKLLVVDELRRQTNDGVQRLRLLLQQLTEPHFHVADTSNWILQLTVSCNIQQRSFNCHFPQQLARVSQ